ncbi:hypothetical protein ACIQWB_11835 [Streptomyces olivaceus]|uniref:hypothetical protein n=1 Tax=Streptomyces olivaceus TaxID=47716 RepID=UPI0037FAC0FC
MRVSLAQVSRIEEGEVATLDFHGHLRTLQKVHGTGQRLWPTTTEAGAYGGQPDGTGGC